MIKIHYDFDCFANYITPMDVYLIIGLPGSGKTHYANENFKNIPIIDDITSIDQLPTVKELVIIDVNFCDNNILKYAREVLSKKYGWINFHHIYFENDVDKARANVIHRDDGRNVEGTLRRFAPIYNPPENAIRIWQK